MPFSCSIMQGFCPVTTRSAAERRLSDRKLLTALLTPELRHAAALELS